MKKTIVIMAVILVGLTGFSYLGINLVSDVLAQAEQKATKCITCNGTGACLFCAGKGKTNSGTCYTCKGTGKCKSCNGTGTVWAYGKTPGGASTAPTR
ncbi:MAG: hypothetical protein WAX69_02325 [Victivallales bacterium]